MGRADVSSSALGSPMSGLMLDSLQIEQYRLFEKLVIPRLGRVNLITGKNNVGKTSVLEALRLYATRAEPSTLLEILVGREEMAPFAAAAEVNGALVLDAIGNICHGRPSATDS